MVPYGTIRYHKVPYGTIWYHTVPYGTIWYHMVPYGTLRYLGRGGARRCWDAKSFSDFWPLKKSNVFFISKIHKNHQNSSNIKEFWPFDVWKRIPMKFRSFWSKNHWKLTILSRVMILFGFKLKIWYHKGTLWYHMIPYSTIRYPIVP